eukprot:TRINITY_DN3796_c0_g1_i15.p1 TRINITY_DN3796_c0_g1~~TRINITY_DN3796_c0_g1_i15.p1  ORF type:complete len:868 (-),score=198.71 TRINITY_DN3796_c0_g1_i15:877-3237(-)
MLADQSNDGWDIRVTSFSFRKDEFQDEKQDKYKRRSMKISGKTKTLSSQNNMNDSLCEVHCWDFNSQSKMSVTRGLFFTQHSVFLIVFNPLDQEWEKEISYWVQTVIACITKPTFFLLGILEGHNSSLIIKQKNVLTNLLNEITNKLTQQLQPFHSQLKYDFAVITSWEDVSLIKAQDKLLSLISRLTTMGQMIPSSYQALEAMLADVAVQEGGSPIITRRELLRMASFFNLNSQKQVLECCKWLHNIGSIIYYPKDSELKDLVVLNPLWLSEMIKPIFTKGTSGVIEHQYLHECWNQYGQHIKDKLLYLLMKFGIALTVALDGKNLKLLLENQQTVCNIEQYSYQQQQNRKSSTQRHTNNFSSLIPIFLAPTKPNNIEDHWPLKCPEDQHQFVRLYSFDHLPEDYFPRLMVRVLESLTTINFMWRFGVVGGYHRRVNSIEVFVEVTQKNVLSELYLKVRGTNQQITSEALENLVQLILAINKLWKGLKYTTHCVAHTQRGEVSVPVESLLQNFVKGERTVTLTTGQIFQLHDLIPDLCLEGLEDKIWPVEKIDFLNATILGEGGFGIVIRSSDPCDGKTIAIKKCTITEVGDDETSDEGTEQVDTKILVDIMVDNQTPSSTSSFQSSQHLASQPSQHQQQDTEQAQEEQSQQHSHTTKRKLSESSLFSSWRHEVMMHTRLKHKNVIEWKGVTFSPFCIGLEFMEAGDLYHLVGDWNKFFSWELRHKIMLDSSEGLKYLHDQEPPIAHLDVKALNIMMSTLNPKADVVAKLIGSSGINAEYGELGN